MLMNKEDEDIPWKSIADELAAACKQAAPELLALEGQLQFYQNPRRPRRPLDIKGCSVGRAVAAMDAAISRFIAAGEVVPTAAPRLNKP
jgi:hypothetical protein